MKIKKIMVSQPKPELERSPYFELARIYGVEIDFRPFIQIEPIPSREFRKNRIDILSYGAVIMTSKNAVDHFFRMCNEMRIIVPETMKYFCISDATAFYLQKYIQYRKRKIFTSNYSFAELADIIGRKHREEKFLLPCAIDTSEEYTELLDRYGIRYARAPMYKASYSALTDIKFDDYDLLVLFSSAGLASLLNSFPDFRQNNIRIAAFGEQTVKAVLDAGFKLHIHAPQAQAPSMATALDHFLKGEQANQPWQQSPISALTAKKKEIKKRPQKAPVPGHAAAAHQTAKTAIAPKTAAHTVHVPRPAVHKPAPRSVAAPAKPSKSKAKPAKEKSSPQKKHNIIKAKAKAQAKGGKAAKADKNMQAKRPARKPAPKKKITFQGKNRGKASAKNQAMAKGNSAKSKKAAARTARKR